MKFIDSIQQAISEQKHFVAFEYFPPRSHAALSSLYQRIERMTSLDPMIASVTWAEDGSTAEESVEIADHVQSLISIDTMVNITGSTSTKEQMRGWLDKLKDRRIHNVLLLRGSKQDSINNSDDYPFRYAVDLVRFVREEYGSYFGISVAGYPEGHPECHDYNLSLLHLKAKVDAGADVIITQMIFDSDIFIKFCHDCQSVGITAPIIPGIMPIYSYAHFKRCVVMARKISPGGAMLRELLDPIRNDDAAVKKAAVHFIGKLVKDLMRNGVRGFYFFTMNQEVHVADIISEVGIGRLNSRRDLPWRQSCDARRRSKEQVRPIHWAGRSKSYLFLTSEWNEFPNGRWGNTQSPAFREDSTYHTSIILNPYGQCSPFVNVKCIGDMCDVFLKFLSGASSLPWCDELSPEADLLIDSTLKPLNARSLFTINSQPPVNGAASGNPFVGWGPLDGYVYQKSYLEFFCPPNYVQRVLATLSKHSSIGWMMQETSTGSFKCSSHFDCDYATAVTWGVFPGQEIQQPTIVSRESFIAWVPEAFKLWSASFKHGAHVPPLIKTIQQEWAFFTVVDNEFTVRPTPMELCISELCDCFPLMTHYKEDQSSEGGSPNGTGVSKHMPQSEVEAISNLRRNVKYGSSNA